MRITAAMMMQTAGQLVDAAEFTEQGQMSARESLAAMLAGLSHLHLLAAQQLHDAEATVAEYNADLQEACEAVGSAEQG
jgi:hypothetical protein